MRGEIVSVGTELLLGQITNTNARFLAERLAAAGVFVYHQIAVGDNPKRVRAEIRRAMRRAEVVIVTGGLGPTGDDLTRESLAQCLGVPLVEDPAAAEELRRWFAARGREPGPVQMKQALCPEGGRLLPNPRGTAPGVLWQRDGRLVALLPGPPGEMRAMFDASVFPLLREASGQHLVSRHLRVTGIGEGQLQERLGDVLAGTNPTAATYAKLAEVEIRVTARARSAEAAARRLGPVVAEIRRRLGWHIYGEGDVPLEAACGGSLLERGLTVSVAESVTGGLIAERLTRVPGASAYLRLGVVAYAPEAKAGILGIPPQAVGDGVSAEVAGLLAERARIVGGTDIGVGACGFAGPDGRDVGLVYAAISGRLGAQVRELRLYGDRQEIRQRASQAVLTLIWEKLNRKEQMV